MKLVKFWNVFSFLYIIIVWTIDTFCTSDPYQYSVKTTDKYIMTPQYITPIRYWWVYKYDPQDTLVSLTADAENFTMLKVTGYHQISIMIKLFRLFSHHLKNAIVIASRRNQGGRLPEHH